MDGVVTDLFRLAQLSVCECAKDWQISVIEYRLLKAIFDIAIGIEGENNRAF
ncbi:hypothetical protein [Parasphingorhabdus sp.]|uniref:hypothetical protein n=1 Tax=Alphaproteobacteria TaxID=28211 RepID=UPI00326576E0